MLDLQQALDAVVHFASSSPHNSLQISWADNDFVEVFLHATSHYWWRMGVNRNERLQHIRVAIFSVLTTIKNQVRKGEAGNITVGYVLWLIRKRSYGEITKELGLPSKSKKKETRLQEDGGELGTAQRVDDSEKVFSSQEAQDSVGIEATSGFALEEEEYSWASNPEELLAKKEEQRIQRRFAFLGLLDEICSDAARRRRFRKDSLTRAPNKRGFIAIWRWAIRRLRSELFVNPLAVDDDLNLRMSIKYCETYNVTRQDYDTMKSRLRDDMLRFLGLEMLREICSQSEMRKSFEREHLISSSKVELFKELEAASQMTPHISGKRLYDTGLHFYYNRLPLPKNEENNKAYKRLWLSLYCEMAEFTAFQRQSLREPII
jgi:hypothetical protein